MNLPHLHGCGPTEALCVSCTPHRQTSFRTFTGAAPLKPRQLVDGEIRRRDLPHLHGCGPTEACNPTTR